MIKKNKKIKYLLLASFFVFLASIFLVNSASADCDPTKFICFENPFGTTTDLRVIIGAILRIALGLLGSFFLVMVIVGGYMWIFSAGNKEKFKKGKDLFVWAVAGLAVALTAYGILTWVMQKVLEDIGSPTAGGSSSLVCPAGTLTQAELDRKIEVCSGTVLSAETDTPGCYEYLSCSGG